MNLPVRTARVALLGLAPVLLLAGCSRLKPRRAANNPAPAQAVAPAQSQGAPSAAATQAREVRSFPHPQGVNQVCFLPDGRRALSVAGDVRLWDLQTGQVLRQFPARGAGLASLALSPDGRRALSPAGSNAMVVWGLDDGNEVSRVQERPGTCSFFAGAFTPDGRQVLLGDNNRVVRCCDAQTGQEVWRVRTGLSRSARHMTLLPDGNLLCSDVTAVLVYDPARRAEVRRVAGQDGRNLLALAPDRRRWLVGTNDRKLLLWDAEAGADLRTFPVPPAGYTQHAAFSPDGRRALSGGDDKIVRLWDVESGRELAAFAGHTSAISGVAFAPDGRLALSAGGFDNTMRLWQLPQ